VSNKYYLDLSLSYEIWTDRGEAKFDKVKQTLTLELPVRQTSAVPRPLTTGEVNSGVEDDGAVSDGDDDAEDLPDLEQETAAATPVLQEREHEVKSSTPVPDTGQLDAPQDVRRPSPRREQLDITPSARSLQFVRTTPPTTEECGEESSHDVAATAAAEAPRDILDVETPADEASIVPWLEVVRETTDTAASPSKRDLPLPLQRYVSATSQLLRPLPGQLVPLEDVEHIPLTRWHQTRQNLVLLIPLADVREVASLQLSLTGRVMDLRFLASTGARDSWSRKHAQGLLRWGVDPRQWHANFSTTGEPCLSVVLRKSSVEMWDDAFDAAGLLGMARESSSAIDDAAGSERVAASLSQPAATASTTPVSPSAVIVEDSAELDVAAPLVYASSGGKTSDEAMPLGKTDTSFTSQSAMAMGQAVLLRTRLMYELL
jgi:hypothetical protein